jgi:hypothetical protein
MKINLLQHKLGLFLFSLGALVGLTFNGMATWADFEASNFDMSLSSDTTLPTLRCPVMISPRETGMIRASFSNPTEGKLTRRIRVRVTQERLAVMEEEFVAVPLAPGETKQLAWPVDSENVVWERLILARVYQHRNTPLPSRSSACGVVVADMFGLPGNWISAGAITFSLLCMVAGILLRVNSNQAGSFTIRRLFDGELSMKALTAILTAGMLNALLGQWMLGAILVVVAALLVITVVGHFQLV